jgi:hypothetical protein
VATAADVHHEDHAALTREALKEGSTMALYVSLCLLAELIALPGSEVEGHVRALALIWGTTIGLALAHWFAFQLSARLVASGELREHDAVVAGAQVAGAAAVALVASLPVVLLPGSSELDVVRFELAVIIAGVGFGVARTSGASRLRAVAYGGAVLVLGAVIAGLKNILSGH